MEQSTGYNLLKTWAAFVATAREQSVAQVQDWLLSLLCVRRRGFVYAGVRA